MEILITIIKELALIAAIIFLLYLIGAMIIAPIKAYQYKKKTEKITDEFIDELIDEIFNKSEEKTNKKPRKAIKKENND
jgi:mannitol-specific phosphotransferase system IIBC component